MALWIETAEETELRPNATEDDFQSVIRAVYRQVLGNHHVMESQRLVQGESLLRNGDITVRGFVRFIAQSDLYRSLFFENSSSYRFIELNFKHLLGRAPEDQSEISDHVLRYNSQGYTAEIDSYIDSTEYLDNFGENTVPHGRSHQTQAGLKNVAFNRTFALDRGFAAHSGGKTARLVGDLAGNRATAIVAPLGGSGSYNNTGKRFRVNFVKGAASARMIRGNNTIEVGYAQLSQRIQNIQKSGGRVVSITEVA
jgi:phycoerythrin-associated linker protein